MDTILMTSTQPKDECKGDTRDMFWKQVKSPINVLSTGKTPGDDGYSIEFYKSFQAGCEINFFAHQPNG